MKRFPRPPASPAEPLQACMSVLPDSLNPTLRRMLASCVSATVSVRRRDVLVRAGAPFRHLYLIVRGAFKAVQPDDIDGERGQIVSFQWSREFIGMDGFADRRHATDLVALESSTLYEFPVTLLEEFAETDQELLDRLLAYVAMELTRAEKLQQVLGSMTAVQKIAYFLLALPGASESAVLDLPMTRQEIGNFLGLSMETVSRLFSRLRGLGVIDIEPRRIRILRHGILHEWRLESANAELG